jgi:hypothetical protein
VDPCDGAAWSSDLPLLVLDTEGQAITDDPRIVAELSVIDYGPGERNCLARTPNGYVGRVHIEYRGSTSQYHPKKSYGFETQTKDGENLNVELLGLPGENDWVLNAPYSDKTMIRNVLAYGLFRSMGRYASRTAYNELVINGEYWGVHILLEKVKIDDDRVDLARLEPTDVEGEAVTGGYIVKVDKHTGSGEETWASVHADRHDWQFHHPQEDVLVAEQRDYIRDLTLAFEDVMAGPDFADPAVGYPAFIDVDSFVDFMLMQELGRTVDGYRSSAFVHKDRGGKLTMGPIWDFNVSFGHTDYCDGWLTSGWQWDFNETCSTFETQIPFWWPKLLEDPAYTRKLRCRWDELRAGSFATPELHARIDEARAELLEAQDRNFYQWPIIGVYVDWNPFVGATWDEDIDYLRDWVTDRAAYMDSSLPGRCD